MPPDTDHLRRFIHRLHRRAVLVRVAEQAAWGLVAGSVAALIITGLDWHWGVASLLPAAGLLIAGAAGGAVVGLIRRPSALQTAVVADQQLALDDLLSTAVPLVSAASTARDPWQDSLLAIADQACSVRMTSAISLRRLGARAWGFVGIAASLSLLLATLATATIGPTASASSHQPKASAQSPGGGVPDRPLLVIATDSKLSPTAPGGPDEAPPAGQSPSDPVAGNSTQKPADNVNPEAGGPSGQPSSDSAGGKGFGHSPQPNRTQPPTPTAMSPAVPAGTPPATTAGKSAGGSDSPSVGSANSAGNTGKTGSAATAEVNTPPPWRGGQWKQASAAAREQLSAGKVSPAYRSLVRDYFDEK